MSTTFTLLSDVPSVKIDRCVQMLPNKLQCYRPGFWLATETPDAPPDGGEGESGKSAPPKKQNQEPSKGGGGTKDQPTKDTSGSSTSAAEAHPTGASPGGQGSATQVGTSGLQTSSTGELTYQLCNTHKIIMENASKEAAKTGKSAKEVEAKMLGDEENYRLNHMPVAPEEKHRHEWLAHLLHKEHEQQAASSQEKKGQQTTA